jgi:hypothetical protein
LKLEICEGGGADVDMILHYKFSTTIELQSCCCSISLFRMLFYIHQPFFPGIMLYIALSVLNPSLVRIIKNPQGCGDCVCRDAASSDEGSVKWLDFSQRCQ